MQRAGLAAGPQAARTVAVQHGREHVARVRRLHRVLVLDGEVGLVRRAAETRRARAWRWARTPRARAARRRRRPPRAERTGRRIAPPGASRPRPSARAPCGSVPAPGAPGSVQQKVACWRRRLQAGLNQGN
ncbi:hypothetical protein ON010_g12418 [Phytophthora cinnamomi]|nr:hypothetical protein ON010_g12418 [Phytophthora cinnamomi]